MINDHWRSVIIAISMIIDHTWCVFIDVAMNIDRWRSLFIPIIYESGIHKPMNNVQVNFEYHRKSLYERYLCDSCSKLEKNDLQLVNCPTRDLCIVLGAEMEKAADAADTSVLFFSQLVLIFKPRARKTMREECFTHFIISTRAISTSAISINNAFSCYLQIFHNFIGNLRCFIAIFWC